jgi:hypothetical protein
MFFRSAVLIAVGWVNGLVAAGIDSSDIIFDDSKIHAYELRFYYPNWLDSLKYYKSLPDEEYIPARFVYRKSAVDSIVLDSVGVRYKGNSSYDFAANSPKKPFKFSFDKYRNGRFFFGVKKLNFSNGAKDPTMMREKISYDIIGRYMPAPRAAFATITIEGRLVGLYTQVEQVDKNFLARAFKDNNGNLYKSIDNGSTLLYRGVNQSSYESEYELKTNETANDWSSFIAMVDKLNNTAVGSFTATAGTSLELGNICRYLAFNMVFSNFDSYTGSGRNYYLYDDPTTKKYFLIPWDLNLSFGVYANNWNVTTADIVAPSNLAQRPLNKRVLEIDTLRRAYLLSIKSMMDGPAGADAVSAMALRWKTLIDSCVQADSNKLHSYVDFVKNIGSDVSVVDGMSRTTIPGLTSFCTKRSVVLKAQLDNYLPVTNPLQGKTPQTLSCAVYLRGSPNAMTLRYVLNTGADRVRLDVLDASGKSVRTFDEGKKTTGAHDCSWNDRPVRAGVYLVKLTAGQKTTMFRVVVTDR